MTKDPKTVDPNADPVWRMRWWLLASMACVLFALGYVLVTVGTGWDWPLFAWGLAMCAAGLSAICVLYVWAIRREEATAAMRTQLRRRLVIYAVCWLVAGLMFGSTSAALDLPWLDVVVTAYVVLVALGGLYAWRRIARRASA